MHRKKKQLIETVAEKAQTLAILYKDFLSSIKNLFKEIK